MSTTSLLALVANGEGEVWEIDSHTALGRSGVDIREPVPGEVSPAPYGTSFYLLPGRSPIGKNRLNGNTEGTGKDRFAVALIPPPGYTRTLLPAYKGKGKEPLPFFAYSMGAFSQDDFIIAAIQTEKNLRWDPSQYNSVNLKRKIDRKIKRHPENRLLRHLRKCALDYQCYNAQNIFYERWEGGIPVSPNCNAVCRGCISVRRSEPPFSPQERIAFIPTAAEIAELGIPHLQSGQSILSFGQGCEGEPMLQGALIEESIRAMRRETDRGTVNINTNGSLPGTAGKLIDAGLDSIRVSLNSAVEEHYNAFYRPAGYTFSDVRETVKLSVESGIFCSLNLLVMPGVTDSEQEVEALFSFIEELKPSMIQLRNLNIDPELYFSAMPAPGGAKMGMAAAIGALKEKFPALRIGNFSPPLRD